MLGIKIKESCTSSVADYRTLSHIWETYAHSSLLTALMFELKGYKAEQCINCKELRKVKK